MVCKNCGADLKPGIKYCLECGSYIDDEEDDEVVEEEKEDDEVYEELPAHEELAPVKTITKKKRRIHLTLTDYLIYAGLLLIMIASIVVIIVVLVRDNNRVEPEPTPVVQPAKTVDLGDYSVTVPKGLDSTPAGDSITVSDDTDYTFTFMLRVDDYDVYQKDHSIIENQLKGENYIINSVSEKGVSDRQYLTYEFQKDKEKSVFYLTKINSKYTAMGVINKVANGNWEAALPIINEMCSSIEFESEKEK